MQSLLASSWSQDIESRLPMTVTGGRLQECYAKISPTDIMALILSFRVHATSWNAVDLGSGDMQKRRGKFLRNA